MALYFALLAASPPLPVQAQESPSPVDVSPGQEGLPPRAIPELTVPREEIEEQDRYVPLFRLTRPYYDNPRAILTPDELVPPDPSTYREVAIYQPPQGLFPVRPDPRDFKFTLTAGLLESYDSNLRLTPSNQIGDFYTTPSLGLDLQLGSPDSAYDADYDTITALHIHYDLWGDIFSEQSELDAIDQRVSIAGRIGRSSAIWRPYLSTEDVTGSNLLSIDRAGRAERQFLGTGVIGQYKLTSQLTWSQTFSHLFFNHPDPTFINFEVWRSYQELGYLALHDLNVLMWTEERYTDASKGADGNELMGGLGWRGRPDPRLFTELLVGYDDISLQSYPGDRKNLSTVHVSGYTTFDWTQRLALTLRYDRGYIYDELSVNDNFIDNSLQFIPELFLGGNWYLTSYNIVSYNEYEMTYQKTLEIRPELEVSYALANHFSRVFAKIGYDRTSTLQGPDMPVEAKRISVGFKWQF